VFRILIAALEGAPPVITKENIVEPSQRFSSAAAASEVPQ
jgi:hypothetical protein